MSFDTAAFLSFLISILLAGIGMVVLYGVVRLSVVHALRRARREQWTETFDAKNAHWLTPQQKAVLATRAPQID